MRSTIIIIHTVTGFIGLVVNGSQSWRKLIFFALLPKLSEELIRYIRLSIINLIYRIILLNLIS